MRFAYALLCHKNPEQINLLIDILNTGKDSFFIHLDAKADFLDKIRKGENIYFSEKRIDVKWGHHSQIYALIELLKTAAGSKVEYDYLWVISGQDLPIKSRDFFETYLEKDAGSEFIEINRYENNFDFKLNYYYPDFFFSYADFFFLKSRLGKLVLKTYLKILKFCKFKRKNIDFPFYKGTIWITITRNCAQYIVDYIDSNPELLKRFCHTLCADEFFFDTIILNSPFKKNVVNNSLRYVDWSTRETGSPRIFNMQDLHELLNADSLFARKFDPVVDQEIIDYFQSKFKGGLP